MDIDLRTSLLQCETDVDQVLERLSGDEKLYARCLLLFLDDKTVPELSGALKAKDWDAAFTAAHALKGLAGNLGFVPLFHASAEMVILIRSGRIDETDATFREIARCHRDISRAIFRHYDTLIAE